MPHSGHLPEIVLLLAAAVIVVALFRRAGLTPVLGYLAAGVVLGPSGFSVISDASSLGTLAEFGVVFLLFVIGLELSFERLKRLRSQVFGFGTAQVLLTTLLVALVASALGESAAAAIVIGGGLALSSTAIVLQLIGESGDKTTQVGRLSLSTLIMQDLAVIPLLVLVPLLAQPGGSLALELGEAFLKAAFGLAVIIAIGRMLLRPLFRVLAARSHHELFVAATLLVVLGLAYVSTLAGMSPALGAFVAGLLVAETEFKPQVEADILPFKGIFLGLFFVTVGLGLDFAALEGKLDMVLLLTAAFIIMKATLVYALCRGFGFAAGASAHGALLLAQGSEFAFVLFAQAASLGIFSGESAQVLLAVVSLSMAATPLLHFAGRKLAARLDAKTPVLRATPSRDMADLSDHVIIAGFGRVGTIIAKLLEAENIPYIALDMDAVNVGMLRGKKLPIFYGDASRPLVLKSIGLERARAMILSHGHPQAALQTIHAVRAMSPLLPIIARARNIEEVLEFEAAGANLAVAEMFETSLQIGGALLKEIGVPDGEIGRVLDTFRARDYALARSGEGVSPPNKSDFSI